jgi:hypothetical protein
MRVVIDVPDRVYKAIKNSTKPLLYVEHLIQEGTPLPKGPCEDCVSRKAIIKTLNEMDRYIADGLILCESGNKFPLNEVFIVDDVYEKIGELPSVRPARKKGKWIKSNIGGAKVCSICQAHVGLSNFKYCPNCGAEMESEE